MAKALYNILPALFPLLHSCRNFIQITITIRSLGSFEHRCFIWFASFHSVLSAQTKGIHSLRQPGLLQMNIQCGKKSNNQRKHFNPKASTCAAFHCAKSGRGFSRSPLIPVDTAIQRLMAM
jgi:hypothetical protein